jgi:pimeloyl-ACP methyl ester carboxylesterase
MESGVVAKIPYRKADVDGFKLFYRDAGRVDAPAFLLLHGFPSAVICFSFEEIREAHRVMEANEANGKLVVVHA